jgi:glutamate synthase (NADPH/NADH) small chain
MYGIPNMKLDKRKVVDRRVNLMREEGVEFVTGADIGKDPEWSKERLARDFDATVLCCGATKGRDLPIDNREANGVHMAMDFLTANTSHQLDHDFDGTNPEELNATGKDVIVIGGGDTGTDCVGTSLRQKCKSVIQLEIMPMPPMERAPDNPWPEWPKVYTLDYGQVLSGARSIGGMGMISSWMTLLHFWRRLVPTQSVPVSPPPMTITSFPVALSSSGLVPSKS